MYCGLHLLPNPPNGVGDKFYTSVRVKSVQRGQHADNGLGGQVAKGQAAPLEVLGHGDGKANIRLDHAVAGGRVAVIFPAADKLQLLVPAEGVNAGRPGFGQV